MTELNVWIFPKSIEKKHTAYGNKLDYHRHSCNSWTCTDYFNDTEGSKGKKKACKKDQRGSRHRHWERKEQRGGIEVDEYFLFYFSNINLRFTGVILSILRTRTDEVAIVRFFCNKNICWQVIFSALFKFEFLKSKSPNYKHNRLGCKKASVVADAFCLMDIFQTSYADIKCLFFPDKSAILQNHTRSQGG